MNYRIKISEYRAFFASLLLFLAILQIIFGLGRHLRLGLIDFDVYYQYGKLLMDGKSPYGTEFTQGIPFNYPPSSFILFAPLSMLPELSSSVLFTQLSIGLFLLTVYFLLHLFFYSKTLKLLLLVLLFQNFPLKFSLVMGQVNLIVLSLIILAFIFDQKKRPVLSGLFWGAASSLKMTPLTLVFYYILGKRYKSIWVGITTFFAINLIFLVVSPDSAFYLTTHLPMLLTKSGAITTLYDQSLRAFFARLMIENNTVLSLVSVMLLLLIACGNYLRLRSPLGNLILFSQILILTTIGNSFAWQHHFVLAFPGFIAAVKIALRKKRLLYFIILASSAIMVGFHFPDIANPPTDNPILLSHTLFGAVILYFLLLF